MRAKHIVWTLAALLIAAGFVLVAASESRSGKSSSKDLAEVLSGIEKLKSNPDIELTGSTQDQWFATRNGGKLDRVRKWLRLPPRYYPLEVQILSFRDSEGRFIVQYTTSKKGLFSVEVYLDEGSHCPSSSTIKLVRKCLPKAGFHKGTLPFRSRC
jgi:hypothetical protein